MTVSFLIVLTGSLGDIARALCLPAHLKAHFPGCRLTWLVETRWQALVSGHPHIDRSVVFEKVWRYSAAAKVLKQLNRDKYDIALDLQRIFKSGLLSRVSGAGRRIGFHPRNAKEMNWLFNNEHIGYQKDHLSKLRHYLKFCEHLGLPPPQRLDFGLASVSQRSSRDPAIRSPYIAVVMGSSWPSKNWHLAGYRELILKILASNRHAVVLLGDRNQAGFAGKLKDQLPPESVTDLVNRTSIGELVGILGRANAALGPDTGSGHLAAAVGTPYVALIGPTLPERVAPHGCEHLVVKGSPPCSPCAKKRCPEPRYGCMENISADAVFDKLEAALNQRQLDAD
jgi:ADP-heptose:LPS heptosyltransferase